MKKAYYIVAYAISLGLFDIAKAQARTFRGYQSVGGEILIFALPVLLHIAFDTCKELSEVL